MTGRLGCRTRGLGLQARRELGKRNQTYVQPHLPLEVAWHCFKSTPCIRWRGIRAEGVELALDEPGSSIALLNRIRHVEHLVQCRQKPERARHHQAHSWQHGVAPAGAPATATTSTTTSTEPSTSDVSSM